MDIELTGPSAFPTTNPVRREAASGEQAGPPRFELGQSEPKSGVLPLHHGPVMRPPILAMTPAMRRIRKTGPNNRSKTTQPTASRRSSDDEPFRGKRSPRLEQQSAALAAPCGARLPAASHRRPLGGEESLILRHLPSPSRPVVPMALAPGVPYIRLRDWRNRRRAWPSRLAE